jgi:hypothetical protein
VLGHKDFVSAVIREFPVLTEAMLDPPELLHVQMGEFVAFTQRAIERDDLNMVRRCFALADRFYRDADPELENAINVSFLEGLDFRLSPAAKSLMSPALHRGWVKINEYLDKLLNRKPRMAGVRPAA